MVSNITNLEAGDKFKVKYKGKTLEFEVVENKFDGECYARIRQTVLKSQYSEKDVLEQKAFDEALFLEEGQSVFINNAWFTTKIHGDYIDGVEFV